MCQSSKIFELMADSGAPYWTPAELADILECDADTVRMQLDLMCAVGIACPAPAQDSYALREEYAR